jgi:hypothetical protein
VNIQAFWISIFFQLLESEDGVCPQLTETECSDVNYGFRCRWLNDRCETRVLSENLLSNFVIGIISSIFSLPIISFFYFLLSLVLFPSSSNCQVNMYDQREKFQGPEVVLDEMIQKIQAHRSYLNSTRKNLFDSAWGIQSTETISFQDPNLLSKLQEKINKVQQISNIEANLFSTLDEIDQRRRLLYLLQQDLYWPKTALFSSTDVQQNQFHAPGIFVTSLSWVAFVSVNVCTLSFILMFGASESDSLQLGWLRSLIFWLVIEIFLVQSFCVFFYRILLPSFVSSDLIRVKEIMSNIFQPKSPSKKDLLFSTPEYLFVSWNLAQLYPTLPESEIILTYCTDSPILPPNNSGLQFTALRCLVFDFLSKFLVLSLPLQFYVLNLVIWTIFIALVFLEIFLSQIHPYLSLIPFIFFFLLISFRYFFASREERKFLTISPANSIYLPKSKDFDGKKIFPVHEESFVTSKPKGLLLDDLQFQQSSEDSEKEIDKDAQQIEVQLASKLRQPDVMQQLFELSSDEEERSIDGGLNLKTISKNMDRDGIHFHQEFASKLSFQHMKQLFDLSSYESDSDDSRKEKISIFANHLRQGYLLGRLFHLSEDEGDEDYHENEGVDLLV